MSPVTLGREPQIPPSTAPRYYVVQTVSPDYRQLVWQALAEALGFAPTVVAGDSYFASSVLTRHTSDVPLRPVVNHYLLRRRFLVQRLPIRALLSADTVVCELNPRILSTWFLMLARRLRGRPTLLWGHTASRRVSGSRLGPVRTRFRLLADGIIVYTASEAREAMRETPQLPTFVAPNALMRATAMVPRRTLNRPWRFLYVGRLAPEKKPELLLNAFLEARSDLAADTRLTFVGDGPSAAQLQRQARESGLSDRIDFCGHLSDLGDLKAQYSQTLASVSPGYAGLSLTQSLGFGVPMLIADREPHAPEIEAAVPEFNCRYFTADSPSALALALTQLEHEAGLWISRAAAISQACRDTYSIDRTAASLAEALTSF